MSRQIKQDRESIASMLQHLAARNREVASILYGFAPVVPECEKAYKSLDAQAARLEAFAKAVVQTNA